MFGVLLIAVLAVQDPAAASAPSEEQIRFFEMQVRPILVEHCDKCHGEKKQWGGLRLDSRQALITGGENGPAVVPGKPEESLLIRAVRQVDENLKMPEDGKLSDAQIAALVRWVEIGAPFPDTPKIAKRTRDPNHWSFQPPAIQMVPPVANQAWVETPIDAFVLAKLEAAGIKPADRADKQVLLRRVTFDLTGLPPTAEEIAAFENDNSPDAYAKVIDRLLESPAYGERWGRHWLDVARYADSNGLDENIAHGNAWRYRDYVVGAFNHDKPFDRFVREQLAGDLLPAESESQRHETLIATGFISIGPKVLAEVNEAKMRMDIVDEQVDTVGRVFLGMTLGCARCHDHKFDPIGTADYYGLAGIFKSTRTMDTYVKVAKWHENILESDATKAMQAAYDTQLMQKKEAVQLAVSKANEQAKASIEAGKPVPENLETLYTDAAKAEIAKVKEELAALEKNPPELPSAMGVAEDATTNLAIHVRGNPQKLGEVVPRRTLPVVRGPHPAEFTEKESGRKQLADWLVDPSQPMTARVFVNRVWRWHFGKGLVPTVDNFGLLGEKPTHPELLDWLAQRFVADGWSIKKLHRLILASSTYQQGSSTLPEVIAADPENRLWGRMRIRRLEAEEVRDAMLAVSGQLDFTMGGSLLKVKNRGYLFDHTSIDLTDYRSNRRSLYLPVIRNNVYDLFQLLDFPDPAVTSGDRAMTTVAPQALLMLNSELVMQSGDKLAEGLLANAGDSLQRVNQLYLAAYSRRPTAKEVEESLAFVSQVEKSLEQSQPDTGLRMQASWSVLCHTIFAANEFIYVQ